MFKLELVLVLVQYLTVGRKRLFQVELAFLAPSKAVLYVQIIVKYCMR